MKSEYEEIADTICGTMKGFTLAQMGVTRFMDIPMPNGKTIGHCTGGYSHDFGQWMEDVGRENDHTIITADALRARFDEHPELLIRYRDLTKAA